MYGTIHFTHKYEKLKQRMQPGSPAKT